MSPQRRNVSATDHTRPLGVRAERDVPGPGGRETAAGPTPQHPQGKGHDSAVAVTPPHHGVCQGGRWNGQAPGRVGG